MAAVIKTTVLFYGNCQTEAIKSVINLNKNEFNYYTVICFSTVLTNEEFDVIIKQCDIIITQPIVNNYRNKPYLSTEYIINNCKKDCKIILFNSCYFDFYYFDLTYTIFKGDTLHKPVDYHYNELINCYKNKLPIEYYLENFVNNVDLKTEEYLEQKAENSIRELIKRSNDNMQKYRDRVHHISIANYIQDNYKEKLLFYSVNHPSKYVLQHICEEIVDVLDIKSNINYKIDPLSNVKCILYKCIQKAVDFNVAEYMPFICDESDVGKIAKLYYDVYDEIGYA
jgi:hypothetical protein